MYTITGVIMKFVKFGVEVDENRCTGCKTCEGVCPTGAISVVQKKAQVRGEWCVACFKCQDYCQNDAIEIVPRSQPLLLGVNPLEVDQAELRDLCIRSHLHPDQFICLCTGTRVREVAAAVLKGAQTPEEIALMTGARSGCTVYCTEPILRLLKAHGVALKPSREHNWYDITINLWDIPDEVRDKHPGYYFKKDKDVFRKF